MLSSKPLIFEVHELVKDISNDLRSLWEILHYAGQCKSESELPNDVRLFTPEEWEQIAITLAHWHALMEECNSLHGETQTKWIAERGSLFGYMRDIVKVWTSRIRKGGQA